MQPSPCPPRRKSKLRKTKVNPKSLLKEQKLRGAKMEEIKRFKHDHQHNRQSISVIHGVEKVHDASNGWSNGDKEEANEEGNGCSDTEGKS
jgi:Tfp pilus assembly protein PilN